MPDTRPTFRMSLMRKITMSITATGAIAALVAIGARHTYTAQFGINETEWLLILIAAGSGVTFLAAYVRDDYRRTLDALEVRVMQRLDETDDHVTAEIGNEPEVAAPPATLAPVVYLRQRRRDLTSRRRRSLTTVD